MGTLVQIFLSGFASGGWRRELQFFAIHPFSLWSLNSACRFYFVLNPETGVSALR